MKSLVSAFAVSATLLVGGYAPAAFADPTPTPSPGQFCGTDLEGKSANASDGSAYTCTKGSDGRDRWTASTSPSTVGAGKFCGTDLEGKSANASDGSAYTCTKGSDGRDRWTKK
jgi:hypothetical protein